MQKGALIMHVAVSYYLVADRRHRLHEEIAKAFATPRSIMSTPLPQQARKSHSFKSHLHRRQ